MVSFRRSWGPVFLLTVPPLSAQHCKAGTGIFTYPLWKDLAAVKAGWVYEIPEGPYNWMDRPHATKWFIGIFWLGQLLYPQSFKGDLLARAGLSTGRSPER